MANKAVIIGLDGATWQLFDTLLAAGIMPNLQRIIRGGTRAVLRSTMPPYTAPAWTTFATGVNPGKHGCYDFLLPTDNLENFDLCNSNHIRTATIYELLHQAGKRSILINLPNSYPPKLSSPTITDMLTVGDNCVFPETLKARYPELRRYRLAPDESLQVKGKLTEYIDDIIAVERDHMAVVKTLWQHEPWDMFFYLFSSTDWISHAMFNQLLELHPKAMELFKFIDDQLGWFCDQLPPDANLYILSDHGFKVYHHTFYFNKWLEQQGYLVTRPAAADSFHQNISKQDDQRSSLQQHKRWHIGINQTTLHWLSQVKPIERAARWLYHHVAKPFLPIRFSLDVTIDFSKTKVCFPKGRTMTAIYINDGRKYRHGQPFTEADYLQLRAAVAKKLAAVKGPDGQPVTPRVYTKEEIYGTTVPERCPDLFYEFGDYWFVGQFHSSELFVKELSNKHDPFGMFVAYGPTIKAGAQLPEQPIAAVTATVLHDLQQPLPQYFDAKVMDIFTQPQPVRYSNRALVNEHQAVTELINELVV
ncbi:MAG: alkaline phosphatase family protein [Candidatus Kerfeldbacteria bacterium]|nr:alkaline phosphatase family protein [Candidatus Kerfeldbacteria bacterium]